MQESELYLQRAAEHRRQADATDLANVRDQCLRAEAAWTAMAERSLRIERARAARSGPLSDAPPL